MIVFEVVAIAGQNIKEGELRFFFKGNRSKIIRFDISLAASCKNHHLPHVASEEKSYIWIPSWRGDLLPGNDVNAIVLHLGKDYNLENPFGKLPKR